MDVEDSRRRQLIGATIDTIAEVGFSSTTLALIGQRAGVSAGLISHYFEDKDGLLEATLRTLASRLAHATTDRLRSARTPRERVQAVIDATLAPEEFDPRTCGVWLAFWGQVIHSARLKRVQTIYQQRMLSNLRHGLRQLVPAADAGRLAIALAAMIDGLWLRATLSSPNETDSATARAMATAFIDGEIARHAARPEPAPPRKPGEGDLPVRSYIGGVAVASATGKTFPTINPANGRTLAEVEIAGETEIESAVAAAKAAQPAWAAMTGMERGRILRAAAVLLRERNGELALLETRDTGKPIQETAAVDVLSGADCLEYFAGIAGGLAGEHIDLGPSAFGYTRREPLGIVAGIGAWNYPLQIACWKAAPALACGNAMIFKPAELTPLSAVKLAEIFTRGRAAGRHLQRRPRLRRYGAPADPPSRHRQGLAHRRGRHRQGGDGGRGFDTEARHARAWRQVAADRLRGCRHRRCGIGGAPCQFLLGRRGLLERHPRLRPRQHQGAVP